MQKKRLFFVLKTVFTILSFYFVYSKIKQYDLSDFFVSLGDETSVPYLVTAILLMPLNWYAEALKWEFLMRKVKKISKIFALKSVLAGLPFALISPGRTGEIPGRALISDKKHRGKAIAATFAGSLSQMSITLFAGFVAGIIFLFFYPEKETGLSPENIFYLKIISFFSLIFILLFFFNVRYLFFLVKRLNISEKILSYFEVFAEYSVKDLTKVLFLGFLRYFIFSLQFVLLLKFFNVDISVYEAFTGIALTYSVSSLVPVLSFFEVGVRSSAAVVFLGVFSSNIPGIISATALVWIINLVIPALAGLVIVLRFKDF